MKRLRHSFPVLLAGLLLIVIRWLFPERSLDQGGVIALWNALFTVGLWLVILILSAAAGRRITTGIFRPATTRLESILFETAIGLGLIAYGVLALGLVGALNPITILGWAVLLAVIAMPVLFDTVQEWRQAARDAFARLRAAPVEQKAILFVLASLAGLVFLTALAPPTDYDSLYYHLSGPKQFLDAGRIGFIEDIYQANYPFTVQMLYTLGMAFGSDSFSRLINFTYTIGLCLAVIAFGRRYFSATVVWLAVVFLIGTPIFAFWASWPNSDMAWAFYEFLALAAAIRWLRERETRWLLLAGILTGLALGTKYLALGGAAQLGLLLLLQFRREAWRSWLRGVVLFGVSAVLVASPWYLKNIAFTGNPLYPLFFGGPGWDAERMHLFNVFHYSFGIEKTFWNLLTLPLQLFLQYRSFSTTFTIEILNIFFLLALLVPVLRRPNPVRTTLAWLTLVRFIIWAVGTQQIRLMLPLFPALALLAGCMVVAAFDKASIRRTARLAVVGIAGGLLVSTLAYQAIQIVNENPARVVLGFESKRSFLMRNVPVFLAQDDIQRRLPQSARVKMMWNGQNYYCDQRCDADNDQMEWVYLVQAHPDPAELRSALCNAGTTHLLLNGDLEWILKYRDPTGYNADAFNFFQNQMKPYVHIVRDYDFTLLFEIDCQAAAAPLTP